MAVPADAINTDFSASDNAKISREHWKIMFISGMGFFTDAYDLFIIGVVMALLKPLWHVGQLEEGLVQSTALIAAAFGALLFGRIADMIGRKRIYVSKYWFSRRAPSRAPSPRTYGGSSDSASCLALALAATTQSPRPS